LRWLLPSLRQSIEVNMRPAQVFDPMLQHERTALAWERTAIASMVAGTLLARQAATLGRPLGALGVLQVAFGAALLVWTGVRAASSRRESGPSEGSAVHRCNHRVLHRTGDGSCHSNHRRLIGDAMSNEMTTSQGTLDQRLSK
jgi:hypothetical protein